MAELTIRDAIGLGLREALDNDDRVFIMGEDVDRYDGPYAVTRGMGTEYGSNRIKDTPISEAAVVGAGIGSAMAGLRPIVEIMTINFMLLAIDQVVNNAAKLRYMSNGQITVPLVIRTVTGGGAQLGATHSQSLEGWFASVPGLKVAVPSDPYDALGLLRTAIADDDPVIFVEHALLYNATGEVPESSYKVEFGEAKIKRSGKDITIVAYSRMVPVSLDAAEILSVRGIEVEVVDLRTLRPIDFDTVVDSVKKTGRAVVVEEAWKLGGFAGEMASSIQERAFDYLDGPIGRVCGVDVPTPYSHKLESAAFPSPERIVSEIETLFGI